MRGKRAKSIRRFIEDELLMGEAHPDVREYVISPKGVIHVKPYTFRAYYQVFKRQWNRGKA